MVGELRMKRDRLQEKMEPKKVELAKIDKEIKKLKNIKYRNEMEPIHIQKSKYNSLMKDIDD